MNGPIGIVILFLLDLLWECASKKLILLPYYSKLCNNTLHGISSFYDFTISQQLNFETANNITNVVQSLQSSSNDTSPYFPFDSDQPQYYYCRVLIKPMGREISDHVERGEFSFWSLRVQVGSVSAGKRCSDRLLLQYRHKDNFISSLDSHSAKVYNISCSDSLPIVIPSNIRKLYITYFSPPNSEDDNLGFTINVTSFIYFQGELSQQFQIDLCHRQAGFWCGQPNEVCLFRELKCDGFDSCFDGGSDEVNCTTSNSTIGLLYPNLPSGRLKSAFIDYLPWLALGILPLILMMALVCICNQHRSEIFFEGYEDNLDLDKSHDDNNNDQMWSSIDELDQIEKVVSEKNEIPEDCEDDNDEEQVNCQLGGTEPLIGLHTIACSSTVKADITLSCTRNSINKDYEDIENTIVVPEMNFSKSNSNHSQLNNELHEEDQVISTSGVLSSGSAGNAVPNAMTLSQITDDDYVLEDVGSLLRKVDKSKIPEEIRIISLNSTLPDNESTNNPPQSDSVLDYRSDYILV